jgi:hypothetical protein
MSFASANPSVVRSVKQRDLLNNWLRLRARHGHTPTLIDYQPARLDDELKDIVSYVVHHDDNGWRFIIDSKGTRLAQAYGTTGQNHIGTDLRDYIGPHQVPLVLPVYETCADRQLPIYSISELEDVNGCTVAYERLLLPFVSDGQVSHMIASLKTISTNGKFEMNNLLRHSERVPVIKLRVLIDQDPMVVVSPHEPRHIRGGQAPALAGDIVEI